MSSAAPPPTPEQIQEQNDLIAFTYNASVAAWTFFAIATVIFFMRSVARLVYTKNLPLGVEDFILTLSWFLDVVRMVTFQLALTATRAVSPLNPTETVPPATFWALFTDAWAFLSCTLPKIGVAYLLIRLFRPRPWVRKVMLISSFSLFTICVGGFIITYVQCNPVAGQWNPFKYPETKCWARDVQIDYAQVASAFSAALDFAFAVYPGVAIYKLQMPLWKRLGAMGLMCLGLASFAFAVIKITANNKLLGTPSLTELYTYALSIGFWNSIENDFILIAACMPSVPPMFAACRRATRSLTKQAYGSNSRTSRSGYMASSVKPSAHQPRQQSSEEYVLRSQSRGEDYSDARPSPGIGQRGIKVYQEFSLEHTDTRTHDLETAGWKFNH